MLPRDSARIAATLAAACLLLVLAYLIFRRARTWWGSSGIRRKPSLDFSITGLVYCSMMMFMGLAAINSQANLLFGVFGLMVGILLISGVVSRKVMRRLTVRRLLPDHGCVGRPMTVTYRVTNGKAFWPSLSVTVAELEGADGFTKQPQAYMLHAAPGMTASVPAEVIPRRRGLHTLDRFQISTSFPFGFIKRAVTDRHRDLLLAYPALAQVDRKVLTLCRAAEKTGASIRPRKGGSDEFYGVKEHRPGDNPRWIYWRRSARTAATGTLVAKEMTHVAPPRMILLVDTFLPENDPKGANGNPRGATQGDPRAPARSARASIEQTIAMAASLAAAALDEELSVGLFVWSDGWKGIEPSRGKRHRNDLLSVLARLPRNRVHDASALLQQGRRFLHSGSTAVLFTPFSPDDAPEAQPGQRPRPRFSSRDNMLVLSPASPEANVWFRFDPQVDFAACAPVETQTRVQGPGFSVQERPGSAQPTPTKDDIPRLLSTVPLSSHRPSDH